MAIYMIKVTNPKNGQSVTQLFTNRLGFLDACIEFRHHGYRIQEYPAVQAYRESSPALADVKRAIG